MTTFAVYTDGSLRMDEHQTDELPIRVDDITTVTLDINDDIVITQDYGTFKERVTVTDIEALTRAITQVQLIQAEREAMDDQPMTDDYRKAIFAGLRELFGATDRERRLRIVSAIVGREVSSLSVGASDPLTRAEASRVLDLLKA
jgi:hypothetical protein